MRIPNSCSVQHHAPLRHGHDPCVTHLCHLRSRDTHADMAAVVPGDICKILFSWISLEGLWAASSFSVYTVLCKRLWAASSFPVCSRLRHCVCFRRIFRDAISNFSRTPAGCRETPCSGHALQFCNPRSGVRVFLPMFLQTLRPATVRVCVSCAIVSSV